MDFLTSSSKSNVDGAKRATPKAPAEMPNIYSKELSRIESHYPIARWLILTGRGEGSGGASGSGEGEEDGVDELHLEYLLSCLKRKIVCRTRM